MKIAIMKGGANITFSSNNKSAANADILYAIRTIDPWKHDITIITHKTRNTIIPKPLKFQEIQSTESLREFDILLMFNFSVNFFGGAEDINLMQMYKLMARNEVPIIYVQTDGQLQFKQVWPSIWKREWSSNYKEKELEIDPNMVAYITQGKHFGKIRNSIKQKDDAINPYIMEHFPWERTILANHKKHFKFEPKNFEDRKYELIFGGATRNTYKRKKIEKYYHGKFNSTLVFGNLRGVNTMNSDVHSKVSYQEFIKKMQSGCATITICDELYNDNFFTLRMYESILAGCLVFIDQSMDTEKQFYKSIPNNCDDLYVKNSEDVAKFFTNYNRNQLEEIAFNIREEILNDYEFDKEHNELIKILNTIRATLS